MTIIAEQLIARIPDFELDGAVTWGSDAPFNRGTRAAIPVRSSPGPRIRR